MEDPKGPEPDDMSLQEIEDFVRHENPGAWGELQARAASHSADGDMPTSPDGLKGFSEDDLFQWVNQNPSDAAEGPNVVIRFMRTRCTQELITRGWTVAALAARTGRTTEEIADLAARRWDEDGLRGE
jgi:hypothetical protein